MKNFKAKKKKNFFKYIFLSIFIYVIFQITFNTLFDFKLEKNNRDFIISLLSDSKHNLLDKFLNFITDDPTNILAATFNYNNETSSDGEETGVLSDYVEDPNPIE